MWKSLWGLTWDLFTFSRLVVNSYMEMLISGHRFADAGIDAMGCVREQEFS